MGNYTALPIPLSRVHILYSMGGDETFGLVSFSHERVSRIPEFTKKHKITKSSHKITRITKSQIHIYNISIEIYKCLLVLHL